VVEESHILVDIFGGDRCQRLVELTA